MVGFKFIDSAFEESILWVSLSSNLKSETAAVEIKISWLGINFLIALFISPAVSTLITLNTEGILTLTLATISVTSNPRI